MENQNPSAKPNYGSVFARGAIQGLKTSSTLLLMMTGLTIAGQIGLGIAAKAGVAWAATLLPTLGIMALAPAAVMVMALALFSGVTAVDRAKETEKQKQRGGIGSEISRAPDLMPVAVPMMGVAADRAPDLTSQPASQQSWAASVGGTNRNNVQAILANGALSDKNRASAILAEREAQAAAANSR
jgi:hypothetical protein